MIGDHNLPISEQDYRNLDYPSYSMLSSIANDGIDVMFGEKNKGFNLIFGSLVDDICFMENEYVLSKYHCKTAPENPTPNVKQIVDSILSNIDGSGKNFGLEEEFLIPQRTGSYGTREDLWEYKDEILDTAKRLGKYKNYTEEKILKTVIEKGKDYFRDILESQGKVAVKPDMWHKAFNTATTLMTHPFSSKYFVEDTDIELIYQFKFVTKVNGIDTKGMLDVVRIDHKNKIVYPVDLKTGEPQAEKFEHSLLAYNYYIQAALYREALKSIVASDPDLKGYVVAEFEFLYISKMNVNKPIIYVVPEELHQASLKGFTDRYGVLNQGVYGLLKKYNDCKQGRYCLYTKEVYENDGRVRFEGIIKKEDEVEENKDRDKPKQKLNILFATGK